MHIITGCVYNEVRVFTVGVIVNFFHTLHLPQVKIPVFFLNIPATINIGTPDAATTISGYTHTHIHTHQTHTCTELMMR